jgi:sulfite dehydrogenase (quinone) subunit SoeC
VNPAYSVILFTTSSGTGYGLLALLGLVGINHGQASSLAFATTSMVGALGLITVGLLSSTFHLGHPERAWRALSQWRSSWLSREGVAAVATYPVALAFAVVWSGLIGAPWLIAPLGALTAILGMATVVCTGKIYSSLTTIRQWNTRFTVPVYLCFAAATGATLLGAIAVVFGRFQVAQAVIASVAVVVVGASKYFYWRYIDTAKRTHTMAAATGLGPDVRQWEVPHTNVNYIQKEMGFVVARKHALSLRKAFHLACLVAFLAIISAVMFTPWFMLIAAIAMFFASVVERWLFFAEAQHVVSLYYGAPSA